MIIFLRHAQAKNNVERILAGRKEGFPLTQIGLQQAEKIAKFLKPLEISAIYSSPIERAISTAKLAAKSLNLEVKTDSRLTEIEMGMFSGMFYEDMFTKYGNVFLKFYQDNPIIEENGVETFSNVKKRVLDIVNYCSKEHKGQNVLLVTHMDPIKAILSNIKDNCIVISPIVPMIKTNSGFEFISFIEKKPTAFEMVQKHMKDKTKLVAAFHTVSEKKLVDPNLVLDSDIFICGDDQKAIETVSGLVREIKNLRPLILGPGSLSYLAEVATPILLNAMIRNKMKNPGLKIV